MCNKANHQPKSKCRRFICFWNLLIKIWAAFESKLFILSVGDRGFLSADFAAIQREREMCDCTAISADSYEPNARALLENRLKFNAEPPNETLINFLLSFLLSLLNRKMRNRIGFIRATFEESLFA